MEIMQVGITYFREKGLKMTTPQTFIWEDLWQKETREFSDESTRLRRSIRKIDNLKRLGITIKASQRLIDMGSGTGGVPLLLRQQFEHTPFEIVCVEKSPNAATKLRSKLSGVPSITVLEEDVCNTSVATESFDIALAISIVEHVKTDTLLLQEISRVLKPGGVLFLCQSNRFSANFLDWLFRKSLGLWPYGYQKYFSITELRTLLEQWFEVEEHLISFPDSQSPFYQAVDRIINIFSPNWGRNIFVRARKKGKND